MTGYVHGAERQKLATAIEALHVTHRRALAQAEEARAERDLALNEAERAAVRLAHARSTVNVELERVATIASRRDEIQREADDLLDEVAALKQLAATLRHQISETPWGALYMERFGKAIA